MSERLAPEQFDSLPDIPGPSETPVVVGHTAQIASLLTAHREGRLHHGLLFAGPRGIGKATLAFRLAEHLIRGGTQDGAGTALSDTSGTALFRMIASGAHPGVLHLSRPFDEKRKVFRTAITADEIKRVNRFLSMTAHDGGHRVVIVDPADDMNRHAANALLKNLEEPPTRTIFILIAHQPGQLLPTIRSRCHVVRFDRLPDDDLARVLDMLGQADASPALLEAAAGSAREALLLSHYGGLEISETIGTILTGARFDAALAYRLADAVTGREQVIQFELFNQIVLDRLSGAATRAAADEGGRTRAAAIAEAWTAARDAVAETDAYNLDKRHHVVTLLKAAHDALRG